MLLLTKKSIWSLSLLISILILGACSTGKSVSTLKSTDAAPQPTNVETLPPLPPTETSVPTESDLPEPASMEEMKAPVFADVISVEVSGSENAYQFAVEIRSPDTGCEQYADWWEVITEDGELIYRRILTHSHVNEQPFTRSGGPVAISADAVVIVRPHMFPNGYGDTALRGSVTGGFEEISLDVDFASELENIDPLPNGCAF